MGRKQQRNKGRRRKKEPSNNSNFVFQAGPGCYIARPDNDSNHAFHLGWEHHVEFDDDDEVPEIAIDPELKTLSLCNVQDYTVVAYITIYDCPLWGRNHQPLQPGSNTNAQGMTQSCITWIVLCPSHSICHLCYLPDTVMEDPSQLKLDSDVQQWRQHPNPDDPAAFALVGFPLLGGPFLCTQGVGGHLTHFFSGNLHALDFQCPVGTPLLAVGKGRVIQTQDDQLLSGIAVPNLFQWNSILLQLDNDLFVEYVHISKSNVQLGDSVEVGQVIGWSGSVGFSPEPHLHFAAYRSAEPTAPTVPVSFVAEDGTWYLPHAGNYYNAKGPCPKPSRGV